MSQDSTSTPSWDVVAAELRAYRDEQKQTWGELDSALIGRYLAGEVNDEERTQVEASLQDHPELRALTEIVSDVLSDCSPTAPIEVEPARPRILSFTASQPVRKNRFQRSQRLFALAAAACLMLGLGIVLDQQPSSPNNAGSSLAFNSMEGDHKSRLQTSLKQPTPVSQPEDVVARANDLVEKKHFGEAADVLFLAPPRTPRSAVRVAAPLDRARKLNEAVVNLTEQVLETMPPADENGQKNDGSRGSISGIKFMAAPEGKENDSDKRNWILSNSLPYLVAGVNQQEDRKLQRRSADALGRMGSYAAPAVPQLGETLRNSNCPVQQTVLTEVFRQLGPEARPAAKDLEYVADKACKEVQTLAREALLAVRVPDWIGIRDEGKILDVKVRERLNARIRDLSRRHHVSVVAEAVRTLPANAMATYTAAKSEDQKAAYLSGVARKRGKDVGAERGVYLFICMDPPAVQVALGLDAQAGKPLVGVAADAVKDRLEKSLKKGDYDKGIEEEVVQMIQQVIGK